MSSVPTQQLRASSSTSTTAQQKRIFCYGDSLTAGTTYPSNELFPYGIHLENELNEAVLPRNESCASSASSASESPATAVVRWRGLPGWTASAMADCIDDPNVGLRPVLDAIRDPPLSLAIILVGTNDVGALTSSVGRNYRGGDLLDARAAAAPILRLHEACLAPRGGNGGANGLRTLAVGIPGSAWQDGNPTASRLCADINGALKTFASGRDGVSYVDFPFPYRRGDGKWSGDGLHLSPEGYETLGRELAPRVKRILDGS